MVYAPDVILCVGSVVLDMVYVADVILCVGSVVLDMVYMPDVILCVGSVVLDMVYMTDVILFGGSVVFDMVYITDIILFGVLWYFIYGLYDRCHLLYGFSGSYHDLYVHGGRVWSILVLVRRLILVRMVSKVGHPSFSGIYNDAVCGIFYIVTVEDADKQCL